jgi:hypothetical protein
MVIRWPAAVVVTLLTLQTVSAQSYVTAMGLRMGSEFGITLQQKLVGHLTAEGILNSSPISNQTTGTLLIEIHNPLISKRFNFYIGGGLHNRWLQSSEGQRLSQRGVSAIAGAEMTLGRVNLAWDYKPVYHLNIASNPFESQTAVSLRYVFVKKIKGGRKNKEGLFKMSPKEKKQKEKNRKKKLKEKEKRQKAKGKEPGLKFPKNIFNPKHRA